MNKNEIVSFIYKTNILKLGTVKLKNGDFSDYIYDFGNVYSPDDLSRLAFGWLMQLEILTLMLSSHQHIKE